MTSGTQRPQRRPSPRRTSQPPKAPPSRRQSKLYVIAAVGIAVLLIFTALEAVLPDLAGGGSSDDDLIFNPPIEMTPGGQEAEMRERLEKDPNDVNAMLVLADLLANTGRGGEAIPWYEQAIQHRPDDYNLRIAFGRTLMQARFPLDAQLQFERARELAPTNPEPVFLLGQLFMESDPPREDQAREMYEEVLRLAPDSTYAERAQDQLDKLNQDS